MTNNNLNKHINTYKVKIGSDTSTVGFSSILSRSFWGYENKRYFSTSLSLNSYGYSNKSLNIKRMPINNLLNNKNNRRFFSNTFKLNKSSKVWINSDVFMNGDLNTFSNSIVYTGKIKQNVEYNILLKLKKGDIYLMIADKQQHFTFNSLDDLQFKILFEKTTDFIYHIMDEYSEELEYEFDDLLLEFFQVKIDDKLKVSNIDKLNIKSSFKKFDIQNIKREFDMFGPKLKVNGILLGIRFNETGLLDIFSSVLKNDEKIINFVEKFNKEVLNNNNKYLGFNKDNCEIFSINLNNRDYIIICNKLDKDLIEKSCFNIYGSFINRVKDSYSYNSKIENVDHRFISKRESKNKITYFNENHEILRLERKISFDSIRSDFKNIAVSNESNNWIPNTNIGVLDLEAYTDDNTLGKPYAIGFYTNKDKSCNTYYINKDLNHSDLIHRCVNDMLKDKYKNIVFYAHNFGRYDSAFVLKNLSLYNKTKEGKENPYMFEPITRNADIIKIIIKRKIDGKIRRVKIQDSATILTNSLHDLCKAYEVKNKKGYFPYDFVNIDTLFYIGNTPDIKFYVDIPEEEYKLLYKEEWSLKEESLIYLEKDLYSLYEVLDKVNKGMFLLFKKQMTNSLTISSFSSRLFLEDFYQKDKAPLPLTVNRSIWLDLHKTYYGGRNEVFIPIIKDKDAYYYDVNSLYPYAMLNPMSGLNWLYVESIPTSLELNRNGIELNKSLFGWFYCKIKTDNNYLGLLPYRTPEGNLIFPVGTWYGWYFSEELKLAAENKYEIEIIKGYITDISYGSFDKYVENVYAIKANPRNKIERNISKLILNSGIGRYGMDYLKPVTKLLNKDDHNIILVSRLVKNSIEIDENTYLDTFLPGVNKEVCLENGVDHTKILNIENFNEKSNSGSYTSVSISTAAATLSYSRIHMAKYLLYILKKGGNLYYMDTDSIITDLKLPEEFVSNNELGKLKLEHTIKEGYFVSDKTYCFINSEGELIKRAKTVKAERLTLDDYRKMYQMKVVNAVKVSSVRDYSEGSVVIQTKDDIKLNSSYYNKRIRIYDENSNWINTKPVYINETSEEERE